MYCRLTFLGQWIVVLWFFFIQIFKCKKDHSASKLLSAFRVYGKYYPFLFVGSPSWVYLYCFEYRTGLPLDLLDIPFFNSKYIIPRTYEKLKNEKIAHIFRGHKFLHLSCDVCLCS